MTSIATPLAMRKKMYTLNNIGLGHLGSLSPGRSPEEDRLNRETNRENRRRVGFSQIFNIGGPDSVATWPGRARRSPGQSGQQPLDVTPIAVGDQARQSDRTPALAGEQELARGADGGDAVHDRLRVTPQPLRRRS